MEANTEAICSYCHQPTKIEWYFCPNCGNKLNSAPLSTSVFTQCWIYAFSIVLPIICYVMVSKWPGGKYLKSKDQKAKMIGIIASTLLALSTIITVWYAIVWTKQFVQSSVNSAETDLSI